MRGVCEGQCTADVIVLPWVYSTGADRNMQQCGRLQCHSPLRVTNTSATDLFLSSCIYLCHTSTVLVTSHSDHERSVTCVADYVADV